MASKIPTLRGVGLSEPLFPTASEPTEGTLRQQYDPSFLRFWEALAYTSPKHPRMKSKKKCGEKWERHQLHLHENLIIKWIKHMKQTRRWIDDRGRYQDGPEPIINGRLWEDDPWPDKASRLDGLDPMEAEAVREGRINAAWDET